MSRLTPDRSHPYWAEAYYGPGGRAGGQNRPGEREGDLAIATVHSTEQGRDVEVGIFNRRPDIGEVRTGRNP